MYYLIVFIAFLLFGSGIYLLKFPFFKLAKCTLSLLNVIIDEGIEDDEKQKQLISRVIPVLLSLLLFTIFILLVVLVACLPFYVFSGFNLDIVNEFDFHSWKFYLMMILGSLLPFILVSFKKDDSDYSDWSMLLHYIVLDNYNISISLFQWERKKFLSGIKNKKENFVIVTGLARSGTTALTKLLYQSNKFHSLSYSNMPFLLAPNLWGKIYKPKNVVLKERAHDDKVQFGHDTIEALEEHFFKSHLKDSYIKDEKLIEHEISKDLYDKYIDYQQIIAIGKPSENMYLSKNNNFLLRYESFRKHNQNFKMIMLFRNPLNHANSLLNQHSKFSKYQSKDLFILDYMDWLGHHEFGLNEKYFKFRSTEKLHEYPKNTIEYWLVIWINYYTKVLNLHNDENTILVSYEKYCSNPQTIMNYLESKINLKLDYDLIQPFIKNDSKIIVPEDIVLLNKANVIYSQLEKSMQL